MDLGIEQPSGPEKIAAQIEGGEFFRVGSTKLAEMLEQLPNSGSMILAAAFRALGARKFWFDRKTQTIQFEPDFKTQMDAVKFLAAYRDGLPVQTSLAVSVGDRGGDIDPSLDLKDALKHSPALRERLQKLIGEPKSVA